MLLIFQAKNHCIFLIEGELHPVLFFFLTSWLTVKSFTHSQSMFIHCSHTDQTEPLQVLATAQLLQSFSFSSHCVVGFLVSLFLTHLSPMKHKRGSVCQSHNCDLLNELPRQTNPECLSAPVSPNLLFVLTHCLSWHCAACLCVCM